METKNTTNANAALPEVRAVDGYNPSKNLIKIMDLNGRESLYLEVKFRKDWFLRWCQANNKCGMLDDSEIAYNPLSKMVEGRATVFVDDKIVAKSAASKPYDPERKGEFSRTVFQDVGTIAMGRALANAGFGTVNCALEEGDTMMTLADAPVAFPVPENNPMMEMVNQATSNADPVVKSPQNPSPAAQRKSATQPQNTPIQNGAGSAQKPQSPRNAQPAQTPPVQMQIPEQTRTATQDTAQQLLTQAMEQKAAQAQPVQKPRPAQPRPAEANTANTTVPRPSKFGRRPDIAPVSTVEEALKAVMPIGNYIGKTLGEIYTSLNRNLILYFAGRGSRPFNNPDYKNLTRACQIILDSEGLS